jgi:flagellar FliL protein
MDMTDEIAPPTDETAPAAPMPKRSYVTALVIAAGLVGGGGFGTFVGGPLLANQPGKAVGPTAETKREEHGEAGGETPGAAPALILLDNLVLNPAGSGGLRFLLVTVGLRLSNATGVEALKTRDAEVRDVLLRILGTKRVDELADIAQREGLKREIKTAVDAMLRGSAVSGVFFPQFVIQ